MLSADIITRGTARFGSPQQLSPAASVLKSDAGIVARLPLIGAELREGDVVLTASGRPLFLLVGEQPAFRDLGPGARGEDVRQLEEALARLGFDPGPRDGAFDEHTESAVVRWYEASGFAPFEASAEQLATIRSIEADVNTSRLDMIRAEESVAAARAALDAAQADYDQAFGDSQTSLPAFEAVVERAEADNATAAAEVAASQTLLDLLRAEPQPTPATAAQIAAAQADLALAHVEADATRLAGEQAVAAAVATETTADIAAAVAQSNAANLAASVEIAVKQAALSALQAGKPTAPPTAAEIGVAEADLTIARANAKTTRLAGERAIAEAQAANALSRAAVSGAIRDMRAAETALENAGAAAVVRYRRASLAASDLELARLRAGVQLPADEVIFVVRAPVVVAALNVARGDRASGQLLTVTDAIVAVDGSLRLDEAPLIAVGMPVFIDEPDLGIEATAVVSRVAASPGTNGVDGFHIYFEVLVDNSPPALVGASVRMTVPVESTGGRVLVVPVSAVTLSADLPPNSAGERDALRGVPEGPATGTQRTRRDGIVQSRARRSGGLPPHAPLGRRAPASSDRPRNHRLALHAAL